MSEAHEEAVLKSIQGIVECLERLHKQNGEQARFNTEVLKTFNRVEQELELLKVGVGEMRKEARHVGA